MTIPRVCSLIHAQNPPPFGTVIFGLNSTGVGMFASSVLTIVVLGSIATVSFTTNCA